MAKNKNMQWLLLAAVAFYFLYRKKEKTATTTTKQPLKAAKNDAKMIAENIIEQTTFTPDETTFGDLYRKDQNQCR